MIFHYIPHSIFCHIFYSFIGWWTFNLFPYFIYFKWWNNKQGSADTLLRSTFQLIYIYPMLYAGTIVQVSPYKTHRIEYQQKYQITSEHLLNTTVSILKKNFFFKVYLFLRDRAWAGEEHRERETQNPKQAPGSEPSAQSPTWGSNSRTVKSWPELKSDT